MIVALSGIRRTSRWSTITPISISTMLSQLAVKWNSILSGVRRTISPASRSRIHLARLSGGSDHDTAISKDSPAVDVDPGVVGVRAARQEQAEAEHAVGGVCRDHAVRDHDQARRRRRRTRALRVGSLT
jgi:hypothetical protein